MATTQDLAGKVVLLTGATDGIGKAAAFEFAKRGASLTIVGRNATKTVEVLEELRTAAPDNLNLSSLLCDLSLLSDIRRLVNDFKATHNRLDVLANNAGATFKSASLTSEGFEVTFALNHLGPFLLTTSLFDLLVSTSGSRVVFTSSAMQARGNLRLDQLPTQLDKSGPITYADAKLCNVLMAKELQRRLSSAGAISSVSNAYEPGMVRTQFGGFGSDQGLLLNIVYCLAAPFSSSPEQGADTLVWLATAPEAGKLKGEFVSKRRIIQPQKQGRDDKLAEELWALSERLCK
ncbi:hypothetical protein JCM8547_002663 [Rhodosporidiobolus lusitaniae]